MGDVIERGERRRVGGEREREGGARGIREREGWTER